MSDPKQNDLKGDYVELTDEQAAKIRGGALLSDIGLQPRSGATLGAKGNTSPVEPCKHDPTRNCC